MAKVVALVNPSSNHPLLVCEHSPSLLTFNTINALTNPPSDLKWQILRNKLKCRFRCSCFFPGPNNRKQEEVRKVLESALGGKKSEFEKWNREIQKREEMAGGGGAGGGGWFGWGRWFGGSDGEHFWKETQQAGLAVAGIIFMYLLIAKGDLLFAVVFNSLLFVLRGTRNGFQSISSALSGKVPLSSPDPGQTLSETAQIRYSAKESVVRKWGLD